MSASSGGGWLGSHVVELADCASTNDEAAKLARAGAAHGTVVIAHAQTAGRGRDGRAWASPPGAGLYLSAVLRPPLPLVDVPPLTLAIGIGACDAAIAAGAPARIKWPNDLLVGTRKLAGILVETQSQGGRLDAAIAGIGVNLRAHADQPDTAIALESALPAGTASLDRDRFVASLLANIALWVDRYVAGGLAAIIPAWHQRMATGLAARATIDGAPLDGEVAGLDVDGALLLRDPRGRLHRVRSGDVQVLRG
ncbi:MAG TPA: biotin--[acetyl-CoA-carboxylase] ligase [Acidimicrobiia bacterium]|jgi:BirA family biotin operon repressor/biotin-[acetyl-CoA-carboxylase] ligase|nr:biotin--[acetyl-CoA-carboxylase] ligase [Acidimicrobiia bacterium]